MLHCQTFAPNACASEPTRGSMDLRVSELAGFGSFRKQGVPEFGVLIIRIMLFRELY